MHKGKIIVGIVLAPIWVPSGLLFLAFCIPFVLLGMLMGALNWIFSWD